MRDWQSVVIGGGIINGLTQVDIWPRERIAEIIADDADLRLLWQHALKEATAMADNSAVPTGTRYDALRMLGVMTWKDAGGQLTKYLTNTNGELQMGAVSGLGDVNDPQATAALIENMGKYSDHNRGLALDALVRTKERAAALLDAVENKTIDGALLGDARIKKIKSFENGAISDRVNALMK